MYISSIHPAGHLQPATPQPSPGSSNSSKSDLCSLLACGMTAEELEELEAARSPKAGTSPMARMVGPPALELKDARAARSQDRPRAWC
jgi:hypothetical protein